jgi:hypothetical protein
MPDATLHRIALTAHTATQSQVVQSLEARVTAPRQGILALRYTLQADMSRIRVAVAGTVAPGRADGLWKHTCFEAFIRPDQSQVYYELNFSAAKQWAAYRFDAYREGMTPVELAEPPTISVRQTPHNLELDAIVALPFGYTGGANELPASARPRLALTAVVEEDSGRLCYWSARHPEGKPDFHHPDGYVFELQARSV